MSRARDLGDVGSKANFLDNVSTNLGDYSGQSIPHIIPDVLYPAVEGKDLAGVAFSGSYVYGTAHTDGRKYYYTDIKGSKPIKDPRIGAHFGSQRHKFTSLQLLEQETATHGQNVYSIDGREWCRVTGPNPKTNHDQQAGIFNSIAFNPSTANDWIEVVGYFNDVNVNVGVLSNSANDVNIYIDGSDTGNDFSTRATNNSPLFISRYVESGSLVNINVGSLTTPGIHTLKIGATTTYYFIHSIELIAQDTSNRSNIQIPSQDVVSYGKKFNVSGTPHYNPFNNQAIGDTASHGKNTVGWTTYDSTLDTATSLGLDAWVDSGNYYRPVNGGRVIKWVDSSGNIKTSVNMMPPSAKAIGSHSGNSGPHETAWTSTYQPVFSSGDPDHSQAEVAKTFHWREFGNGSANGAASFRDYSTLNGSDTDGRAFVMDDGLTSLSSEDPEESSGDLSRMGASDFHHVTFIGTGITIKSTAFSGAGTYQVAQNLPYGTHILKLTANSSTSSTTDWTLDGASLGSSTSQYIAINEVTFHQPKRPPIPEDACVIADYMLMADFVGMPTSDSGIDKISKGVRACSVSRDVFYEETDGDSAFTLALDVTAMGGYKTDINGSASSATACTMRLPAFATNYVVRGFQMDIRASLYIGSTDKDSASTKNSESNYGSFARLTNNENLGVQNWGVNSNNAQAFAIAQFEFVSPIHTSHHYQSFETPFLHELVGGDRNMEQTNLVVSPDGKTWDEVTRDTSYIGDLVCRMLTDTATDWSATVIFDEWRGQVNNVRNLFNKYFAIGYDRLICLEDGVYKFTAENYCGTGSYMRWSLNGDGGYLAYSSSSSQHIVCIEVFQCKKGDYITLIGDFGDDSLDYNNAFVEKLS